jgi:hypothetical protein
MRDDYGYIVQHDKTDRDYADGGDTARSMGMYWFRFPDNIPVCSSLVMASGACRRHPYQAKWRSGHLMSRDNLLCLVIGLSHWDALRVHSYYKLQGWFVNKDWLSPSHRLHIMRCANVAPTWKEKIIGRMFLVGDILWHRYVMPMREQNQVICQASSEGWLKFYVYCSPFSWRKALREYWCGWRDQCEMYTYIVESVEMRISKMRLR